MFFLLFSILIFIFGVIILSFGSQLIVDSALNLAQKLKLSGIAVSAIFIAMITAMPETFITLLALKKSQMIAFGNLVGSNIINIPLAIGLPALITTLTFGKFAKKVSLIMIIATTLAFLLLIDGRLTSSEGWLLIFCYFIYVIYVIKKEKNNNQKFEIKEYSNLKTALLFLVGGILLLLGAYLVVESSLDMAEQTRASELYIGATIVAFGSIISEFAVSLTAAIRKQGEISIGNILGDNIFTIFIVLGLARIIKPFSIAPKEVSFSLLPIIFITFILFLITTKKERKIDKMEGLILLISWGIILLLQSIFIK